MFLYQENRGVGTIAKTIGLFYKTTGKKVLFVVDDKNKVPKYMENYGDISNEFIEGYDFHIYFDINQENYPDNSLVFMQEKPLDENRAILSDDFVVPQNIILVDEKELLDKEFFYTKKMDITKKINVIKNISSIKRIYATKDILEIL